MLLTPTQATKTASCDMLAMKDSQIAALQMELNGKNKLLQTKKIK